MIKADLHVHSRYSERPSEWFLSKLGAAESYTEPEFIYQRARELGMAYVTITDHNNIQGSIDLAEKYNDAFTGVETTTYFPEDGCKVHLLIYGLDGAQFEVIQKIRRDIYQLRDYLVEQRLPHSVAHATYAMNRIQTMEHLEKMVLLFDVFETINGGRNKASNVTWLYFLESLTDEKLKEMQARHGIAPQRSDSYIKGFTGGSDDHAGIYVGQTYTIGSGASVGDFLTDIRERKTRAEGRFNDYQSLAFTVYKVAHEYSRTHSQPLLKDFPLTRISELVFGERKVSLIDRLALAIGKSNGRRAYQKRVIELVKEIRKGKINSIEKNLDLLYDKLSDITDEVMGNLVESVRTNLRKADIFSLLGNISSAIPGLFLLVPFFTSMKVLNSNRRIIDKLRYALPDKPDHKVLWFTDTFTDLNGVSITLKNLGWRFYSSGIDVRFVTSLMDKEINEELPPNTINLPSVGSFHLPYYEQYIIKIPSLLKALKILHEIEPDEIYISTPGPIGLLGLLIARLHSIPARGVYHTDFTLELGEITEEESVVETLENCTRWFYSLMDEIMVPTSQYIDILSVRGLGRDKMTVFPRYIDTDMFHYYPPEKLDGTRFKLPEGLNLLYVGRISKDKNLDFLIDVYREVRKRREDVNLIVTGDGPFLKEMKAKLDGDKRVLFTGRIPYEKLPMIYSQSHALVFPSVTDTFGMVVLEAQCCELPAIVSDKGGPQEIVEDNETGFVLPALNLERWVGAVLELDDLVRNNQSRYREIRRSARDRAVERSSWEAVLHKLLPAKP
jgi:glycosyltransferase involved in cell wall biosynthesis